MPRHINETKAKAFAFVLDQLASALKDVKDSLDPTGEDSHTTLIVPCWEWLIPHIDGDGAKRRHFQTSKNPHELSEFIAEGDDPDGEGELFKQLSGKDGDKDEYLIRFEFTSLIGRLVRSIDGPIYEAVIADRHFDKYFNVGTVEKYVSLVVDDFSGSKQFLIEELRSSLLYILQRIAQAPRGGFDLPVRWPKDASKSSHDAYLAWKARNSVGNYISPYKIEWRSDLLTVMLVASLLGPRDYRDEILVSRPDRTANTFRPNTSQEYMGATSVTAKLDVACWPYLTRVTFDRNPPEEMDWIVCEARGAESGGMLSIPLRGKAKVSMAREISRFSDDGDAIEIPLDCPAASSKQHVLITHDEKAGKWILKDMDSTNGTLVVSRDGSRKLLYVGQESRDYEVELSNGDVICIAPDWASGHAIPTHPAFLFHMNTTDWS